MQRDTLVLINIPLLYVVLNFMFHRGFLSFFFSASNLLVGTIAIATPVIPSSAVVAFLVGIAC
jgi:hypothetical protein